MKFPASEVDAGDSGVDMGDCVEEDGKESMDGIKSLANERMGDRSSSSSAVIVCGDCNSGLDGRVGEGWLIYSHNLWYVTHMELAIENLHHFKSIFQYQHFPPQPRTLKSGAFYLLTF